MRDPKVWTRDGAHWMVLGAQTQDLHGTALLLRSPDLIEWQYLGQLAGGADDPLGYMWECPDLVRLNDRDVLVISPSSTTARPRARTGGRTCRCTPSASLMSLAGLPGGGGYRVVDAGPDFYAPQTLTDDTGRTIMIGWMGMPDHDGQPTLAEKHPTVANGWVHCLTVPRELSLDGDQLVQWPVPELSALRGQAVTRTGLTRPRRIAGGARRCRRPCPGPGPDGRGPQRCIDPGAPGEGSGRPVVLTLDPYRGPPPWTGPCSGPARAA